MTALLANATPVRANPWRGALPSGVLWGCAVLGMESVLQPVAEMTGQYLAFLLSLGVGLVAQGVCIAWLAAVAERTWRLRWLPLLVVATALALAVALTLAERTVYPLVGLVRFPRDVDFLSALSNHAWVGIFYGGMLLVGRVFALRAQRIGRLLGRAELERSRSETALGEVRLQALQGGVDPGLLRDVMAEVQRRQRDDADGAERLLDQLVGFLRLAMPSLRAGPSTLAAELALVRACAGMRAEQSGAASAWRIDVDDGLGHVPFPPLLLLPLLEGLATGPGASAVGALSVRRTAGGVRLELGAAAAVAPGLADRLHTGLRALHGDRFEIRQASGSSELHVEIRLPLQVSLHQGSFPSHQETSP